MWKARRAVLPYQLVANAANSLWLSDQPEDALAAYRDALCLAPEDPVLYRGLGNALQDLGRFEAAERAFRLSLAHGGGAETAWNYGQLLQGLERFDQGYALSEARWTLYARCAEGSERLWCRHLDGLRSGPLRLWSEQGLGDTLQHFRWIGPLLGLRDADAPQIRFEVEDCLVQLFARVLSAQANNINLCPKPADQGWDHSCPHLPLMSLPLFLGGAPLPSDASWLDHAAWPEPQADDVPHAIGSGARVGLVWAAGRKVNDPYQHREYCKRSLSPQALSTLVRGLCERGIQPVALQFGPDRCMGEQLDPGFVDWLSPDADFWQTASVVADLDCVISVDTAMAHLVGAMRRPGWILLPAAAAPRWLRQGSTSQWYPSLRLFRQLKRGDWDGLIQEMFTRLDSSEI